MKRLTQDLLVAVLVDVAVLAADVAADVARLHAERAVAGLEAERVRAVVVQLVDLLQDRHRLRLLSGLHVAGRRRRRARNQRNQLAKQKLNQLFK